MKSIGSRIRDERTRLGLNQTDFANLAGLSRNAQAHYERDERIPDTAYLAALSKFGVDIMYIINGIKNEPDNISTEEEQKKEELLCLIGTRLREEREKTGKT